MSKTRKESLALIFFERINPGSADNTLEARDQEFLVFVDSFVEQKIVAAADRLVLSDIESRLGAAQTNEPAIEP